MTVSLLLGPLLLLGSAAPVATKSSTTGSIQLKCKSQWHQLDLKLEPAGALHVDRGIWAALAAPAYVKPGGSWKLSNLQVLPIIQGIHDLKWKCDPKEQAAYQRWQGSGPALSTLGVKGTLDFKLIDDKQGKRIEFTGDLKVVDAGNHSNRFGPNWWKEDSTHKLAGTARLDADGLIVALELKDDIDAAGIFFTQNTNIHERYTRKGTLQATLTAPKDLDNDQRGVVQALIAQLGSDNFGEREQAANKLEKMGPKIVPLLKALGLTSKDLEVRNRSKRILANLEE